MKIIYMADDGSEFDTYEECAAYESYCEKLPPSIRWYNKIGQELIPQNQKEIDRMYNDVDIWEIEETSTWKEDLEHMMDFFGFGEKEMRPGRYKYIWDLYSSYEVCGTHEILGCNEWVRLEDDE